MAKWNRAKIKRHMSVEEIDQRTKKLEKDFKLLNRLYFIKNRYNRDSVEVAASKSGVTKRVGYIWQERWNKEGYKGLKPKYSGGRPSKLTGQEKKELKELLKERDDWTTKEVKNMIQDKFNVEYSLKQVGIILKNL